MWQLLRNLCIAVDDVDVEEPSWREGAATERHFNMDTEGNRTTAQQ